MNIIEHLGDRISGKAPAGSRRHKDWWKLRNEHIRNNPICAVCHGTKKLVVHHILPYHLFPDKEREPTNLITLCEYTGRGHKALNCHLLIGHLGDYRRVNVTCTADVWVWYHRLKKAS